MVNMKTYLEKIIQHPLVALYGVLLGIIAFSTAIPMCVSSLYDVAFVDIAMAIILITLMLTVYSLSYILRSVKNKDKDLSDKRFNYKEKIDAIVDLLLTKLHCLLSYLFPVVNIFY